MHLADWEGTNTGLDYWNGLLDWTTGMAFFWFLFNFLHSFDQGGVIISNALLGTSSTKKVFCSNLNVNVG